MLLSGNFIKNVLEKYNERKKIEKFQPSGEAFKYGLSTSYYAFLVAIAFIFFIFELFLLYFAILIAINCSESKEERIINFVLGVIFTTPYVLLKITFDPCTKNYLKNGLKYETKEL
jgi:hypothetical protein